MLFTRLSPLLKNLAQAMRPYLDMPFAFFGHSLGALIGYELARQLRGEGELQPAHLFVSACRAPHLPDPDPPIHILPEPEFVATLRRLNGTPEPVLRHAELMQMLLPILRADFEVFETYRHANGALLECPIAAFGGLADRKVREGELTAWRERTRSRFTLRMFPGDHFFLHSARTPLLQSIAQALDRLPHPAK